MSINQIIRRIAEKENKPEWYIKAEIQKAMDIIDWSQLSTDGKQPASFEAAYKLIIERCKEKNKGGTDGTGR